MVFGLLAAGSAVTVAAGQVGGAPRDAAFQGWWAAVTSGGVMGPPADGLCFAYRVEFLYVPPTEELEAIRRAVADRPEHPQRMELAHYERVLAGQAYTDSKVWRLRGMWRLSQSWEHKPNLPYWDFARGRDGAWQLTEDSLTLAPTDVGTAGGGAHASVSSGFTWETSLFQTGGITAAVANGVELAPVLGGEDRWTVSGRRLDATGGAAFTARGAWHRDRGWGTVEESEFSRLDAAGAVVGASRHLATDWRYVPELKRGVAHEVLELREDGARDKRLTLAGISRFTRAEFEALTAVPKPGGVDPVRGRLTFRSISDERGDERRHASVEDGKVMGQSPEPAGRPSRGLHIAGWASAVFVIATVVLLRLRRSHASR
jgi:hypothetical protein